MIPTRVLFGSALLLALAAASGLRAQTNYATPYSFTTLAGGTIGNVDGPVGTARFHLPTGIAVDTAGNLYVSDTLNSSVRKLTPDGTVSTLAGGTAGSADGVGAAAQFRGLTDVAVDAVGNVYVADKDNHTIRKIAPDGTVTTLAGSAGQQGSTDDTGSVARFKNPTGLTVDASGNVFVADFGNSTIRKITQAGVVTTLAGSPGLEGSADGTGSAARFQLPGDVAVDADGNLWVADTNNQTIRQITPSGVVTTLAGSVPDSGSRDGAGSGAQFRQPTKIAVDANGNLYVTDTNNATIRKIAPNGLVTTLAGSPGQMNNDNGTGSAAHFSIPNGIAVDATGALYVTDPGSHRIRKGVPVDLPAITSAGTTGAVANGTFSFAVTSGVFASSFTAASLPPGLTLNTLSGVISGTVTTPGTYTISVTASNSNGSASTALTLNVVPFAATVTLGNLVHTYDGTPRAASAISDPPGLTITLTYNGSPIPPTNAGSYQVVATAGDADHFGSSTGTLTIAHAAAQVTFGALTFAYDGTAKTVAVSTIPPGLQVDVSAPVVFKPGIYFNISATVNEPNWRGSTASALIIAEFATPYTLSTSVTSGFTLDSTSVGVIADTSGNVYVADTGHHRIAKVTSTGSVTIFAGSTSGASGSANGTGTAASFKSPRGLARDTAGNLYVADTGNNLIRKITTAGVVTTFAGGTLSGYVDATGTSARFNSPHGVAVDSSGNLYVADTGNNRIRKITSAGVVTTRATITAPVGIAVDSGGNLYVANSPAGYSIQKITPTGTVSTLVGSANATGLTDATGTAARFTAPTGLAVDAVGNVYVADATSDNPYGTIRRISPAGVVTTLAGLGLGTNSSGDGVGSTARLFQPVGLAVNSSGNLYVIEAGTGALRLGISPLLSNPGVLGATVGQPFTYTFSATSLSGVFYNLSDLPPGVFADSGANNSAVLTGTPTAAGTYTVLLLASLSPTTNTGSLVITVAKGTATLSLGAMAFNYDGTPKAATTTVTPSALLSSVSLSYGGGPAAPTQPGSYAVTATLSDSNYLTTSASGTLLIRPSFAYFQGQNFNSDQLADTSISGPAASPAHDGMGNLMKYAFAIPGTHAITSADWPAQSSNNGQLTLTFVRRKDIADITYLVEVSDDLLTWNSGPAYTEEIAVTVLDSQRDQVVVRDRTPMAGAGRRFIRLRVTTP
jgi:sugar lactone lactonase YvrE